MSLDWLPYEDKELEDMADEVSKSMRVEDITGPPCNYCACWRPQISVDVYGNSNGIILCTSDPEKDFSCYKSKK